MCISVPSKRISDTFEESNHWQHKTPGSFWQWLEHVGIPMWSNLPVRVCTPGPILDVSVAQLGKNSCSSMGQCPVFAWLRVKPSRNVPSYTGKLNSTQLFCLESMGPGAISVRLRRQPHGLGPSAGSAPCFWLKPSWGHLWAVGGTINEMSTQLAGQTLRVRSICLPAILTISDVRTKIKIDS